MAIEKKTKRYFLFAFIVVAAALLAVHPYYEIRYTDSRADCFPYKIWFIDKTDKNPAIGDFIAFKTPPNAVLVPEYKTWVKKVLAAGGGKVTVTPSAKAETAPVEMNGVQRNLPVRARVTVEYRGTEQTFVAFAADSLGRALPIIGSQIIPPGSYYAYSPVPRSYDSRYWGLVRGNEILGKAHPLY
jgi:type IV secretory pathway protease TraF